MLDILVGIPSYNNARTIGHVVRAVQAGLAKYFPDRKAVIVNSDGGSIDGTVEIVKNTMIDDFGSVLLRHRGEPAITLSVPYHGIPGKGSAFRAIFEMAGALNVQACAVMDADLRSITPEWVELLIKPVLDAGFDYVAPLYHRHKFDGTITNSIIYPLTRALYGKRMRQPIGGDFGFSGRLARFYLNEDVWQTDVARYGIDIWMTTGAIANEFKVAQAFLGAKDPRSQGPGRGPERHALPGGRIGVRSHVDLSRMSGNPYGIRTGSDLRVQVRGRPGTREGGRGPDAARLPGRHAQPEGHMDDRDRAAAISRNFASSQVLRTRTSRFPTRLWTRIIYDYALAYHKKKISAEHLLKSLTPLYLGKTASFVLEACGHGSGPGGSKDRKALCRI